MAWQRFAFRRNIASVIAQPQVSSFNIFRHCAKRDVPHERTPTTQINFLSLELLCVSLQIKLVVSS
jgi:hypothetical protein